MADAPPIVVDRVSKDFRLPREQIHTLKERVLHPLRRPGFDVLHALRDVSFVVHPGEFLGIVGRNGSGKSTLLKCLAGIYRADKGDIYVDGRMSTFIELGVGFNPDLAAYDNVLLNATMLGLPPKAARDRYEQVIAFAELEQFQDLKLKNYSSGMMVRLAFSVMIHVDADILLIDEVLAVGDASFQQKCFDEFERIRESGRTVLLVTHDMGAVRRFCDRAVLLEHGRVVENGDPEIVGNRYLQLNFSEDARQAEAVEGAVTLGPKAGPVQPARRSPRQGDGRVTIEEAWWEDETGARTEMLKTHFACNFRARVRFHEAIANPVFRLTMVNPHRDVVFEASTTHARQTATGTYAAGSEAELRIHFGNLLGPDRYYCTVSVEESSGAWLDRRERFVSVVVTSTTPTGAIVELPYDIGVHAVESESVA